MTPRLPHNCYQLLPYTLSLALGLTSITGAAVAQLNCNVGIEFYPNGGIKSCNLNGDHRIYTAQGQPVTCANGHVLVQYPDGKLKSCTLAQPLTFDSSHCDARSKVEVNPGGAIAKCERP